MLERIGNVLKQRNSTLEEVRSRIRIVTSASRKIDANYFELISHAVLERKQLSFSHFNRKRGESAQRHVSPQRLVHYRDNWYLDSFDQPPTMRDSVRIHQGVSESERSLCRAGYGELRRSRPRLWGWRRWI